MSIKKLIVFVILCVSHSLLAQQGFTITGGDFNSTNGSVSIAVGQTFYNINTGASASETQGVEQPCTIILTQPITQGVCVGANVIFTVITTGPSKYQWKKNGLNIGTNSNTLTLNNVALSDSGKYQVLITGLCGTIASNIVKLIIGNNVVPALNITTADPFSLDWALHLRLHQVM